MNVPTAYTFREGLGIDLGLKTGAAVWMELDGTKVGRVKTLATWTELGEGGVHAGATPEEVAFFVQRLVLNPCSTYLKPGMTVGIDWTPNDVFWGARMPSIKKAFAMGYLYMGILAMGGIPLILPPDFLRKYVDQPRGAKKEDVQAEYDRILGVSLARQKVWNEHEHDAVILAYVGVMVVRDPRLRTVYEEATVSHARKKKRKTRRTRRTRTRR